MTKLESDRENFFKSIELFKEKFEKIKKFNNLDTATEFSSDAFDLKD